ncbi:MAG TPA: TadE/TadG family type IV pilus assembly protein [Methylocystis sp.]|nr:TadE/TadG family type IV pilus assembly protein [Methylocystis sp.]
MSSKTDFHEGRIAAGNAMATFFAEERGVAAVEFAFVALPFLAVIMALVQISLAFIAQQAVETATEKASRLVLTGQAQAQGLTQQQFQQTVCANLPALFKCSNLLVDMQTATGFASADTGAPTLNFNKQGQVTNSWQYQPGAANDVVVLRVMYLWPVMVGPMGLSLANLPNGARLLMATAVFQNEP